MVTGVETFGKPMEPPRPATTSRCCCAGYDAARSGAARSSPRPAACGARRFTARVYLLGTAEGGRRTPIATGYRPQFYLRTGDVVGDVDLGEAAVALRATGSR